MLQMQGGKSFSRESGIIQNNKLQFLSSGIEPGSTQDRLSSNSPSNMQTMQTKSLKQPLSSLAAQKRQTADTAKMLSETPAQDA